MMICVMMLSDLLLGVVGCVMMIMMMMVVVVVILLAEMPAPRLATDEGL